MVCVCVVVVGWASQIATQRVSGAWREPQRQQGLCRKGSGVMHHNGSGHGRASTLLWVCHAARTKDGMQGALLSLMTSDDIKRALAGGLCYYYS